MCKNLPAVPHYVTARTPPGGTRFVVFPMQKCAIEKGSIFGRVKRTLQESRYRLNLIRLRRGKFDAHGVQYSREKT